MLGKLHDLCLPHQHNGHRARLLHNSSLLILIAAFIIFQSLMRITKSAKSGILGFATDISIERLLVQTNLERQAMGLPPLTVDRHLSEAAKKKADDMFAKNYWAHNSPDGLSPWDFILGSGYRYTYAGENLAKDFQESPSVVSAWMASPTHRANILRSEYQDVGFAVANGKLDGEETTLVIQMFGSKSPATNIELAPESIAKLNRLKIQGSEYNLQSNNALSRIRSQPLIDIVSLSRLFSLIMGGLMFTVFTLDSLFLWRHRSLRISSHSLAHILFFASLLGTLWFTTVGAIL